MGTTYRFKSFNLFLENFVRFCFHKEKHFLILFIQICFGLQGKSLRWGGVTWLSVSIWSVWAQKNESIKGLKHGEGQMHSKQGKQGRKSALCQASPERGAWLGGGPFVGEVAGRDSLSLATSSPTHTNRHTQRHTVMGCEGSAVQEVRFVRQRDVNTVYITVTVL